MADHTGIEWTDATWNPVVGCSLQSPGCTNCYAQRMAGRLARMGSPIYEGLTRPSKAGDVWTGKVEVSNWGQVIKPLAWRRPRRIFVNSMSDLFHPALPDTVRDQVFAVMALCPRHTFQVLTKRPDVMRRYVVERHSRNEVELAAEPIRRGIEALGGKHMFPWPLPNVWLGVSVEDQARANERIPDLLATHAAVRFLSCEPLLGPVDLANIKPPGMGHGDAHGWSAIWRDNKLGRAWIDWAIVGGESGHGARPMRAEWARDLLRQCEAAAIPAFMKQTGSNRGPDWPAGITGKGDDPAQWPEWCRVQRFPESAPRPVVQAATADLFAEASHAR